jgi:nucleotide-binding universal stress UspA family protein
MEMFSRVLVGVDDSDAATQAVLVAARLSHEHGTLTICHAVDWLPIVSNVASSGAMIDVDAMVADMKHEGSALLARRAETAQSAGSTPQSRLLEGEPATSILDLADREGTSLIVMGTAERKGLERLFVGSTTEAVLRGSSVPVLTVRAQTQQPGGASHLFQRIVVGIDESEPSDAAIETVLSLPADARRQVFFYSISGDSAVEYAAAEYVVRNALERARRQNVTAEGFVVRGRPADMLVAAAPQRNADLIVLGSHGRRGVHHLLLGSVAEHVVRNSPVPVLVVRQHASVPVSAISTKTFEPSPA